jgi:hypothetical protein
MARQDWTRDELILALDLYFKEPHARGSKSHPAVHELSEILNSLPIHSREIRGAVFRNPNGVGMKSRTVMPISRQNFCPNRVGQFGQFGQFLPTLRFREEEEGMSRGTALGTTCIEGLQNRVRRYKRPRRES